MPTRGAGISLVGPGVGQWDGVPRLAAIGALAAARVQSVSVGQKRHAAWAAAALASVCYPCSRAPMKRL